MQRIFIERITGKSSPAIGLRVNKVYVRAATDLLANRLEDIRGVVRREAGPRFDLTEKCPE